MLNSFNVAMVVDPLEVKSVTNTFKEEGAFDVSTAYVYTKSSSSLHRGDCLPHDGMTINSYENVTYEINLVRSFKLHRDILTLLTPFFICWQILLEPNS